MFRHLIWSIILTLVSKFLLHYNDVVMSAVASQITSFTIVYSGVYSGADERKHQSSASLAFVRGIHRPVTGEFPEQKASNAGNVSIWWRHHVPSLGRTADKRIPLSVVANFFLAVRLNEWWHTKWDQYRIIFICSHHHIKNNTCYEIV